MSNPTVKQPIDRVDWTEATDKARETAAAFTETAGHAALAVGAMAKQAASDAKEIASQAFRDVGKKADELTANAGAGIQGLGERINSTSPEAGVFRSASEVVAGVIKEGGEYLQEAKLTGMADDVAHVIRRNPIPSVLIAVGLGWFLGRKMRG